MKNFEIFNFTLFTENRIGKLLDIFLCIHVVKETGDEQIPSFIGLFWTIKSLGNINFLDHSFSFFFCRNIGSTSLSSDEDILERVIYDDYECEALVDAAVEVLGNDNEVFCLRSSSCAHITAYISITYHSCLVMLAGTLTGVQGDIRCKVLAALSTVKYLFITWAGTGLIEGCNWRKLILFIYSFSSLLDIVKIENTRISSWNMQTEDLIVRKMGRQNSTSKLNLIGC